MEKKNKKLSESVALQLISLCKDDNDLQQKAETVKREFDRVVEIETIISHQPQLMLNKMLHSTRAMDTGMRIFLELFDAMPDHHNFAMGPYLSQLKKGKNGCFGRLNGDIANRIQQNVVDKRNKFLHTSGQYPTKGEAEQIVSDVESYLQTILNLA